MRKLAGQAGLTAALGSALTRAGKFPLIDRGIALVSMAAAIALGATSMNDITVLAHHAPVLGAEPSDTTVRRTLELASRRRTVPSPTPGSRMFPTENRVVNCGWVLAANLAADLSAWCRLPGLYDQDDLQDAEPGTLRYRPLSLPARLVRHARARVLKISRTWPGKEAFPTCWQRLCALPAPS